MRYLPPPVHVAFAVLACCAPAFAQQLCMPDVRSGDGMGHALAVSGGFAVVGAPDADTFGSSAGEALLFERVSGSWVLLAQLMPESLQASDRFGSEVAMNQELIAVMAPGAILRDTDFTPLGLPGQVFVYRRNNRMVELIGSVRAPAGAMGFGTEMCFLGDTLCIGARQDSGVHSNAGAVYTYQVRSGNLEFSGAVRGADVGPFDHFGTSISGDDGWLAVGAPADDDYGPQAGAVYMFQRVGGLLIERQKLIPSQAQLLNYAGSEVTVFGRWLAVGLPGSDLAGVNAGSVTLFENQEGVWNEVGVLIASDPTPGASFGHSMAGDRGCLCIGAPLDSERGRSAGAIYGAVYSPIQGWSVAGKFQSDGTQAYDYLGLEVAVSAGQLFGSARNSDDCGAAGGVVAYFPESDLSTVWYEESCICDSGPCPGDGTGGCANSVGTGAVLQTLGGPSILDPDFELTATGLPSRRRVAILFGAPGPPSSVSAGLLCFQGRYRRVASVRADQEGFMRTRGLMRNRRIRLNALPGSTWGFQAYYVDLRGPCGGRINTSQAIWVTFEH
jgi:hypothetical protein